MAEETIAPSEFRDDEHRDAFIIALENEYKSVLNSIDGVKHSDEETLTRRKRRIDEVHQELHRIRGAGYPGHEERLAAPAKQTRAAS